MNLKELLKDQVSLTKGIADFLVVGAGVAIGNSASDGGSLMEMPVANNILTGLLLTKVGIGLVTGYRFRKINDYEGLDAEIFSGVVGGTLGIAELYAGYYAGLTLANYL